MTLTDQERVVLKAIGPRLAPISDVIKAVGYPKAATKKILAGLNEKGAIFVHRHDHPQSLTPAQRKLMLRLQDGQGRWNYYGAVSARQANPIRFEIGRRLSKAEKDEVLKSLGDCTGRKIEGSYFVQCPRGRIVRVDAKDADDISFYEGRGFKQITPVVNMAKQNASAKTILDERIPMNAVATTMLALSRSPFDGMIGAYGDDVRGAYAHPSVLYLLFYAGAVKQEGGEYRIPHEVVQRAAQIVDAFYNDKRKSISGKQFLNAWRTMKNPGGGSRFGDLSVGDRFRIPSFEESVAKSLRGVTLVKISSTEARGPKKQVYDIRAQINVIRLSSNPGGVHLPGLPAKAQREYEDILKSSKAAGRYKGREKEVAARTVRKQYGKNPVMMTAALLSIANSLRIKNPYTDLVIKGSAKRVADGWKIGKRVFPWGRGQLQIKPHVYLDKSTGFYYVKKERNMTKKKATKKRKNIAGFKDESGQFHPIRSGIEQTASGVRRKSKRKYKPSAVGEKRTYAKKRKAAPKRAASKRKNPITRAKMPDWIKRTIQRAKGEGVDSAVAWEMMHASKAQRDAFDLYLVKIKHPSAYEAGTQEYRIKRFVRERVGKRRNPTASQMRKMFAGRHVKNTSLYFPDGTPQGIAKLGKLIKIKLKRGHPIALKNPAGEVWLCCDRRGRLYLGTTINAPLFDGPARDLGEVKEIEYMEAKPHLGYPKKTIWFHHMGEEGGARPTLHVNHKGELKFKGGDYRITSRGIEN